MQNLRTAFFSSPARRLRSRLTPLPSAGRVRPLPGPRLCPAGLSLCGWFCQDVSGGDGAWVTTVVAFGLCLLQNPCRLGQSLPPQPAGPSVREACTVVNSAPALPPSTVPALRGAPAGRRGASLSGRTSESNDEGQGPLPAGGAPRRALRFCPLPASPPPTGSPSHGSSYRARRSRFLPDLLLHGLFNLLFLAPSPADGCRSYPVSGASKVIRSSFCRLIFLVTP